MNSNSEKLNILLDEVLPSALDHCGPSCDELLNFVRSEGRRRRKHTAWVSVIALTLTGLFWKNVTSTETAVVQTTTVTAPLVIRRVNDEELFALLADTPAALVSLPDGSNRLLILNQ